MIEYSDYTDYEQLESLDINFIGTPSKDLETDIYKVYLETPIIFQIPHGKLDSIMENEYERHIATYNIVDSKLVEFFSNLDALIINISTKYSLKWFGKNLSQKMLVDFYENIYNLENDDKSLEFIVEDEDLLEELTNYNIDEDLQIILSIDSLEIYKKTFKLYVKLDSLTYDDEDTVDDLDFEKMITSQKNICETVIVDDSSNSKNGINKNNAEEQVNSSHESDDEELNGDSNGDSNEDSNDTVEEGDILEMEERLLNEDRDMRVNILKRIQNKEEEKEHFLQNSIRATTASATLKERAEDLDFEIQSFREQLKNI